MPVLIYKGDTTDNFGKYLPTPYIEKITIGDEGAAGARLSIFIKLDDNEKIDDVLERIANQINIYLLFGKDFLIFLIRVFRVPDIYF